MRGVIEAFIMRHNLQDIARITGWVSSEQVRDEILARGACPAELCRGPSGGHHGSNGAAAAGHQHIRGRIPELVLAGSEADGSFPAGDIEALMHACRPVSIAG